MSQVTVTRNVRVPMRDGVELSADIYMPKSVPAPGIVLRTPYLKLSKNSHEIGTYFAEHGYVVMYMDVRGRGDSDGEFTPYRNDGVDGYDTIEWLAAQDYCNGSIGTLGGSYLGHVQFLAALEQPPSLKAMIPMVTPSDPFVEWPTGVPGPHSAYWIYMVGGRTMQYADAVDWEQVYKTLPLEQMDEASGRYSAHWKEEMKHTTFDEYWDHVAYQEKFDQIDLPVLHISGWYDDEQVGTPLNFTRMFNAKTEKKFAKDNYLLMGPWPHGINQSTSLGELDFGPESIIDLRGYQRRFFDKYLKEEDNGFGDDNLNVDYFLMGNNTWQKAPNWPLPDAEPMKYYISSKRAANSRYGDGLLTPNKEDVTFGRDSYDYDPNDPVPFITDVISSQIGGADDYSAIERRDDILVYTSEPLEEDTAIVGPIRAKLFVSSDCKDTDFMVKLLDVHPNGKSIRMIDGMTRMRFRTGMTEQVLMTPGEVYEIDVDVWNTSNVFKKGHQIRVEISSSAFPKYDRNLNTGEHLATSSEMKTAHNTVYFDENRLSYIELPIKKL